MPRYGGAAQSCAEMLLVINCHAYCGLVPTVAPEAPPKHCPNSATNDRTPDSGAVILGSVRHKEKMWIGTNG